MYVVCASLTGSLAGAVALLRARAIQTTKAETATRMAAIQMRGVETPTRKAAIQMLRAETPMRKGQARTQKLAIQTAKSRNNWLSGLNSELRGHADRDPVRQDPPRGPIDNGHQVDEAAPHGEWSERPGVVELSPGLSSPNRTCTSQRIRLSIQVLLKAKATSA
jgi:hypothetical protein